MKSGEPFHNGRSLALWLEDFKGKDFVKQGRAYEALEQMKEQAAAVVPTLLLIARDTSASPALRGQSLMLLEKIAPRNPALLDFLREAVTNEEIVVRRTACDLALRLGSPGAQLLLDAVRCTNVDRRFEAAERLQTKGALDDKVHDALVAAVDDWIARLRDPDDKQRTAAWEAVFWLRTSVRAAGRGSKVLPVALELCRTERLDHVRMRAASLVGTLGGGSPEALAALSAAGAYHELVELGDVAVPIFRKLASDPDAKRRRQGLDGLVQLLPPKEGFTILSKALQDADQDIRAWAIDGLRELGEDAFPAVPALIEAMAAEKQTVVAASALGRIGRRALPALMAAMKDKRPNLRWGAALAVEEMCSQIVGVQREDGGVDILAGFPKAVAEAATVVTSLAELLADADAFVRIRAAVTLAQMGPGAEPAIPALLKAMGDLDKQARLDIFTALARIGRKSDLVAPALIGKLKSDDPEVRWAAATALRWLGSAGGPAVEALVTALRDANPVVCAAAEALGEIGGKAKDAVPALKSLLKHPDGDVRKAAASALKKLK
jgi:HEAT repeat protein